MGLERLAASAVASVALDWRDEAIIDGAAHGQIGKSASRQRPFRRMPFGKVRLCSTGAGHPEDRSVRRFLMALTPANTLALYLRAAFGLMTGINPR